MVKTNRYRLIKEYFWIFFLMRQTEHPKLTLTKSQVSSSSSSHLKVSMVVVRRVFLLSIQKSSIPINRINCWSHRPLLHSYLNLTWLNKSYTWVNQILITSYILDLIHSLTHTPSNNRWSLNNNNNRIKPCKRHPHITTSSNSLCRGMDQHFLQRLLSSKRLIINKICNHNQECPIQYTI